MKMKKSNLTIADAIQVGQLIITGKRRMLQTVATFKAAGIQYKVENVVWQSVTAEGAYPHDYVFTIPVL